MARLAKWLVSMAMVLVVCWLVGCDRPAAVPPGPTPAAADIGTPRPQLNGQPVFITTDMSSDDVAALLYLLQHPDVAVVGIGSANGVAHVEPAARNVLRLLTLLGRTDIPVAVGSARALEGDNAFPAAWRGGADALFGLDVPSASVRPVAESASELLAQEVRARPAEVVVVLLGAHTDLALALRDDRTLAGQIKGVHLMGGAVRVPGNINAEYGAIANNTAEWNLWLDYRAAREVFEAGVPLTMVPLDATNQVSVDRVMVEQLKARATSPVAQVVAQLWHSQVRSDGMYVWDAVAAVALTDPGLARWEAMELEVAVTPPEHAGRTVGVSRSEPNALVCTGVDKAAVVDKLITVLNR